MSYKKLLSVCFFLFVFLGSSAVAQPANSPTSQPSNQEPTESKEIYVITDSVVLGAKTAFLKKFADWTITYDGRPALMTRVATKEIKKKYTTLPKVAVVALGYNSLWEKERKNYKSWAARFDKEAEDMISALEERGVEKIIWVTLRESTPEIVPKKAMWQYEKYAWYFGYVNERLALLQKKHSNLYIADWSAASQTLGYTYDAIHLNPKGAKAMVEVIYKAVFE